MILGVVNMETWSKIKLLDSIASRIFTKGNVLNKEHAEEIARRWISQF